MTSNRHIRVYCPEHAVAAEVLVDGPIHCKNEQDEHVLAQAFPPDDFWEYCCDCDRFYPFESANNDRRERNLDLEQCVNCKCQAIRRFLCDQCNVVSVESVEKGEKSYRITGTGLVRLAKGPIRHECPACVKAPETAITEHHCKRLGVAFTTARYECPFCGDEIQPQSNGFIGQAKFDSQTFATLPTGERSQATDTPPTDNDLDILASGGDEPEVSSAQPRPSAIHRARRFGISVIVLARRHAVATASIASLLLGVLALLLSPSIRGPLLNHPPTVSNIVVNPPVIAPGKNVSLIGMASDPDGDPLTYQWSCSTGAVIEWNGQYAQLRLDDLEGSAQGAKLAVHLQVIDSYGEPGKLDVDINVPPAHPNHAPTLNLVSDKQVVVVGEKVILKAEASDKDDDELSYRWSCPENADAISGGGAVATVDTAKIFVGPTPVLLTVSSTVNDGHGNSTSDKVPIFVLSKRSNKVTTAKMTSRSANRPFSLSLSPAEKSWVYAGERLKLIGAVVAPHAGDTLAYQWEASNSCIIEGMGSNVWLDTSTLNPRVDLVVVQVNLIVRDQHGGTIRGSIKIFVLPKPNSPSPPSALPSGTAVSN